jgi:hypothetical protein
MAAKKKNRFLLYGLGAAIIAGAAYLVLKPQGTTAPPLLVPPTGGPSGSGGPPPSSPVYTPPPAPVVLKVGDRVNANTLAFGYITEFRGSAYQEGGSDGFGHIEPNKFAGIITAISPNTNNSVKVQNYTNNMKSGNTNVYDFWMYAPHLKKS